VDSKREGRGDKKGKTIDVKKKGGKAKGRGRAKGKLQIHGAGERKHRRRGTEKRDDIFTDRHTDVRTHHAGRQTQEQTDRRTDGQSKRK
jgi:hypothetical protein